MGEVGVDPTQVAQAASALANLRSALAANVPTIVNTLSEYSADVNTAILTQAQARSVDDAASMEARSRLAQLWLAQGVSLTGTGLVDIPWSGTALDDADAKAEAAALTQAEASKNPKQFAADLKAIQTDLQDHLNDPGWLGAFYNAGGPAVANLAISLHDNDPDGQSYLNRFNVLTKSDQQILATFAQGLATADKSGQLSPEAVQAIANAPNIWSASMLVKYGPPGSAWATSETKSTQNPDGLSLLAVMTDNVWRDEQTGDIRIPIGGPNIRYQAEDQQQLTQTLNNYDPLGTLLQADAQNKAAAWQVMGDTNKAYGDYGAALAKMLMWNNGDLPGLDARFVRGGPNSDDQYPDYFTISPPGKAVDGFPSSITLSFLPPSVAGSFLNAATSAPRGPSVPGKADPAAEYSAQAALTIMENTPSPKGSNGIVLDPAIQSALAVTAQRYLLDLAMSTTNTQGSQIQPPGTQLPVWSLQLNGDGQDSKLSSFLEQIFYQNTGNVANLNAAAKVAFGNIYAQMQLGTGPSWLKSSGADTSMAGLLGSIASAANNDNINVATDLDEQHAEFNAMLKIAEDAVPYLPVVGTAAGAAEGPTLDMLALIGVPTSLSTDNAAAAQATDSENFAVGATQLHIPMVQALINNGAPGLLTSAQADNSKLPSGEQFLHDGQIVLSSTEAATAFNAWYQGHVAGTYHLKDLEATYGTYYNNQGGVDSGSGPW
jgi:hypothetical protein